ncbi:MAG: hybrid sensor histidine kinase/response regulator [Deltaproteobacteria bacterium]|jgi:signal transduction histidine kinase
MNILVVDDEAVMVESIRIGLESSGYRVIEAFSAQQALDHLNQGGQMIDLVVTDYLMPKMNGLDLLGAVRRSHPFLPVVIMTAYAETSLVIEAMKNHCDSFIEKPFSLDQLITEIERIKLYQLQNTRSSDLHQILPKIVHQINNPLLSISGFAELIQMNVGNIEKLQIYAEKILSAVQQIGRINKEIMNAGQAKERNREPVELDALLDGCLEMFQSIFILKGVQVKTKIPMQGLRVLGDKFGLEQVFKNLVLNAVDAMDGRTDKTLTVTVTPPQGPAFVEVTVEDTGCGIREELLNKIFEPYFTDKSQGNGLGLVVTKNAVEKHGGKVLVESQVGVGTRFTVSLPAMQMD